MKPLYQRDPANNEEVAALDLAVALSNGAIVVSVEHQEEAARFVREYGWGAAVDRVVDLDFERSSLARSA